MSRKLDIRVDRVDKVMSWKSKKLGVKWYYDNEKVFTHCKECGAVVIRKPSINKFGNLVMSAYEKFDNVCTPCNYVMKRTGKKMGEEWVNYRGTTCCMLTPTTGYYVNGYSGLKQEIHEHKQFGHIATFDRLWRHSGCDKRMVMQERTQNKKAELSLWYNGTWCRDFENKKECERIMGSITPSQFFEVRGMR